MQAQEDRVTSAASSSDNFERTPNPAGPTGIDRTSSAEADKKQLDGLADRMSMSSPRAKELISDFRSNGGTFEPSAKGGYLDPKRNAIGVPAGTDEQKMRTMAHELGHYDFSKTKDGAYVPPGDGAGGITDHQIEQRREQNFITQNTERRLADEGHATLINREIRDEMRASSGVDIGVSGDAPGKPIPFMPSASFAEQRRLIGEHYGANLTTSTTGESYRAYYNQPYINHYRDNYLPGR